MEEVMRKACQALTKKKKPCPNAGDRYEIKEGRWLCHIHHPDALFRKQVAANREWRKENPRRKRRR